MTMLSKVEIKNYRGFPSYRMEGLAQVNLLVGKNNSGKTSLLEAVQFLASGGDPGTLDEAAQRRGELISPQPDRSPLVEVSHFFNGHGLRIDSSFSVSGDNGHRPVTVKILSSRKHESGDAEGERQRFSGAVLKVEGGRVGEKDDRVFRLTREGGVDLEVPSRSRRLGVPNLFDGPPVRFISTDSLSIPRLAAMWDEITLNGLEGEVSKALQVLEENVQSVHMLSGMSAFGYYGSRGGAVVGLKGSKQRIPLGSMGDGMRRMLSLATSLACTSHGALFADEIDTGLHYSIMSDMWKLVVDRAVTSHVQVFATTHSWDCIEGLSLLCQRERQWIDKVAIHTIDRSLEHSVAFKGESIVRMAKHQIDPR
ncbi:MAG TPA: AAA family ATPase [Phycisphaerae bacterium]|jgi:hypothetical protein